MFVKLLVLFIIGLAAYEDSKEKEIWIGYPFIITAIGVIYRFVSGLNVISVPEIMVAFALIMFSVLYGKMFGLGDALMLSGLLMLCSINGVVRILIDGLFIFVLKNRVLKKKRLSENSDAEELCEAFIPYILLGYLLWIVL